MYHQLKAPVSCQIEVTTACNLSCFHCYNHWRHDFDCVDTSMGKDLLDATIQQIIDAGVFQVTFTGGEPLINREMVFRGAKLLSDAGIVCDLNSNLTLMKKETAQRLLSVGIEGVLTSFASSDRDLYDRIMQKPGSYDKALAGIKIAQGEGMTVAASMVVTNLNVDRVVETGRFLKGIGVNQFYITKASPPVNSVGFERFMLSGPQLMKLLDDMVYLRDEVGMKIGALECYPLCSYHNQERYDFMSSRRCSAGVTTCSVSSTGDVRACSHDGNVYGNVQIQGLIGSWESMSDWRSGILLPQVCKDCEHLIRCSGGCRVDAEYVGGCKNTLDPYAHPDSVDKIVTPSSFKNDYIGDGLMSIKDPLYYRDEGFCVLCTTIENIASPAMLTSDTFELLKHFCGKEFGIEEIACYTGLSTEESRVLCHSLISDGLVGLKH